MEHRTALTLKSGDSITLPGLSPKVIGPIQQLSWDQYRIRLDEKWVESTVLGIRVDTSNGQQRTPERHDGPWEHANETKAPLPERLREVSLELHIHGHSTTTTPLLAGLYGEAALAIQGGNYDPDSRILVDKLCRRVVLGTDGDERVDIELLEESAALLSPTPKLK